VSEALGMIVKDMKAEREAGIADTPVPQEVPAKQWWHRPADSKARKIADKIAIQRAAGRDDKAIAKKLGTTEGTIRQYAYLARKNGWWDTEDEPVDLELDLALTVDRKIVRNVSASLDGQMTNWQTHEMTIAAAKGRGIFKSHEKSESKVEAMSVVAIRIEMPTLGADDQQVLEENMGGTPIYVDAEEVSDVRTELGCDRDIPNKALPPAS
jgi:predicted transcriptional regulator